MSIEQESGGTSLPCTSYADILLRTPLIAGSQRRGKYPCFDSAVLTAVSQIIGDTGNGLTGSEIAQILAEVKVEDVTPEMTKWKRLYNALASVQNKHQVGNHLILLIKRVMAPVRYLDSRELLENRRERLNVVLAFPGYQIREDGQVVHASKARTLSDAQRRAKRLKETLEDRRAHVETIRYCRAELLDNNYFHAVLEAIKGVAQRIRDMSGLTNDGAELVNGAFSTKIPILAINPLSNDTEMSEQKGFANMVVGLFGAIRNPVAHAPKILWTLSEQDALDLLTFISFVHRKLDVTVKV